ncbi:MAG: VOC family protein [Thalassobaculum sp.]|uniref:VOC family protein n=1 Tax=Thalassobaculum sp. TaxID=2022740 RepID=UPI0032EE476F
MAESRPVVIDSLDHLVLAVRDIDATIAFYRDWLGMQVVTFGAGRKALSFGQQKINLHIAGEDFDPPAIKAAHPVPGSGDLCFLTSVPIADVVARADALEIAIEEGPEPRTGARGPINSVYARDPDGNLIEVSNRLY